MPLIGCVRCIKKNIGIDGITHLKSLSKIEYKASLSDKLTRAFIGLVIQFNFGGFDNDFRAAKASVTSCVTIFPIERLSRFWIARISSKMGGSMSMVVLAMMW